MSLPRNNVVAITTRVVVCGALLLLGATVFGVLVLTKPQPAVVAEQAGARPVEVMRVVTVPVQREWSGFGTAVAIDSADIAAEVSGVVAEVPRAVVAGARVRRGDILVQIDNADYAARVEIVTQQLEQLVVEESSWSRRVEITEEETKLAQLEVQRAIEAMERGGAQPREVDRTRTALYILERAETRAKEELAKIAPRRSILKAQLGLARNNLDRCSIKSPLDGFLQSVDVETGERMEIGHRIARVVNLSKIEVPLRLPASARPNITVGDTALLESRGSESQAWHADVDRIGPADDHTTRTMTVYVELDQDTAGRRLLVPGRFVRGTVISAVSTMRTVVPRRSIRADRIQLVEQNVVRSRPVRVAFHIRSDFPELGVVAEQWAVLEDDLPAGSMVIINAARSLPDGITVDPIPLNGDGFARAPRPSALPGTQP